MKILTQIVLISGLILSFFSTTVFAQSKTSSISILGDNTHHGKLIGNHFYSNKTVKVIHSNKKQDVVLEQGFTFSFSAPEEEAYQYQLTNNSDFLAGVNVGDIISVMNQITKKKILTDPISLIAADVNNDGKISVSDIVEIRKLILGKTDAFSSGKSWKFIDATFPLFVNNWYLANEIVTSSAANNFYNEFTVVKMGDVSGRVVAFEQPIAQRSGTSDFNIEYSVQNGIRRFDVYLPNFNVEGIQATLTLDPSLQITHIHPALDALDYAFIDNGKSVKLLLTADKLKEIEKDAIFSFISAELGPRYSQMISLDETQDNLMIDCLGLNTLPVLRFQEKALKRMTLNPTVFGDRTNILISTNTPQDLTLSIFQSNGNLVYQKAWKSFLGEESFSLGKDELNNSGTYFYQLSGNKQNEVGKFIVID